MYTVLIQSQHTLKNFSRFRQLFADSIDDGDIGVCPWVEEGCDMASALPELSSLVASRHEWRAVVVCAEPDGPEARYPVSARNPFDYFENRGRAGITVHDGKIVECEAPLIRLAHLLGGFPSPEHEFAAEAVLGGDGTDSLYTIQYDLTNKDSYKERAAAIEQWDRDHELNVVAPSEIILVKARKRITGRRDLSDAVGAWALYSEAESSTFWKRNLYPYCCRFLVFDMASKGVVGKESDSFHFWAAVLLLCLNSLSPDALQAYRLYRLDISFNADALSDALQALVGRMNKARFQLCECIAQEDARLREEGAKLPSFEVGVPVSFEASQGDYPNFDRSQLALTGGMESDDVAKWADYKKQMRKELRRISHEIDRSINAAAMRLREKASRRDEIVPLADHQVEDMRADLSDRFDKVVAEDYPALPSSLANVDKRLKSSSSKVEEIIRHRPSESDVLLGVGVCFVFVAASFAPSFLHGSLSSAGALALLSLCIAAAFGLVYLIMQRAKLLSAISGFRNELSLYLGSVSAKASAYSTFFGDIASHMLAASYLRRALGERDQHGSAYLAMKKQVNRIDVMREKVEFWRDALHANVDMEALDLADEFELCDPDGNLSQESLGTLYSLQGDLESRVPLNASGSFMKSPLGFVECIFIEREEVYDRA